METCSSLAICLLKMDGEWKARRRRMHNYQLSDDRPLCLENPRPEGAEFTLPENVPSRFEAEPRHLLFGNLVKCPYSALHKDIAIGSVMAMGFATKPLNVRFFTVV